MAGALHIRIYFLGLVLLMGCAGEVCLAHDVAGFHPGGMLAAGSLAGRLTDLYAHPVEGVPVIARNEATGAETRSTTGKHGAYLFANLSPGKYTVEAVSAQLGRGRLEGILVEAGHEHRLVTAMSFTPEPPAEVAAKPASPEPAVSAVSALAAKSPVQTETPSSLELAEFHSRLAAMKPTEVESTIAAATIALVPASSLVLTGRSLWRPPAPTDLGLGAVGGLSFPAPPPANPPGSPASPVPQALSSEPDPTAAGQRTHTLLSAGSDPEAHAKEIILSAEEVASLPAVGRRWQDFVPDIGTDSSGIRGTDSQRDASPEQTAISVDGASQKLAFNSAGGTNGTADGQNGASHSREARGRIFTEAAIREVETTAGVSEAASFLGSRGRVNLRTERGSNELHGQSFLNARQNIWGARNPFARWVKESAPATTLSVPQFTAAPYTPPDHETVWGIGLGSRIRRDRLFWFAALDGNQRNDPGLSTVRHPDQFFAQPTDDQMLVLSARLALPSANPVVEGLSAYSKMLETLAGLLGPSVRTTSQRVGFGRLDWDATERHRFTLEGIGADWNSPGGGLTRTIEPYGNHSFGSSQANWDWALARWEGYSTENLRAVTQFSVGREIQRSSAQVPSAFEQTLLAGNAWGQLPQITVDSRDGLTTGNPALFGRGSYPDEKLYEGAATVDWVHGNLLMKAGFQLNHNADATSLLHNQTGTYSYSSVENFASDAISFAKFGVSGQLDPVSQHNCDQTGKTWRDATGVLHGLGYLPCYSYYSQMLGPTNWNLSTNDWAGFTTIQAQFKKLFTLSAGLRWEKEEMPPPFAKLANPGLPRTSKLPNTGNQWGPRLSVALGRAETHWPVLRLGYGMYFGRTDNATLQAALTQTGSLAGNLYFFLRPTDNLNAGGAPPFPNVLNGPPGSAVKPGAVAFAQGFKNPEIHQAEVAIEERLPFHLTITGSAALSLGRRLPFVMDTNFDPAVNPQTITYAVVDPSGLGPIKSSKVTVPFYANWPSPKSPTGFSGRLDPNYQQIAEVTARANSTYEAFTLQINRSGRSGLTMHSHYTYSHAMDWNPNESAQVMGSDALDPANFRLEYGPGNLDTRHSMAATLIFEPQWKLHSRAGLLANGWMVSSILRARSGAPYSMRTSGSLAKQFVAQTGAAIVALAPGMNGSGGDNRVYGVGRNTYRYPATWKMDMRLARRINLGQMRQLEILAESFNLLNHQNVTELEAVGYTIQSGGIDGAPPTLTFLSGTRPNSTPFGQPLNVNSTNFYRERQIQLGLRLRF